MKRTLVIAMIAGFVSGNLGVGVFYFHEHRNIVSTPHVQVLASSGAQPEEISFNTLKTEDEPATASATPEATPEPIKKEVTQKKPSLDQTNTLQAVLEKKYNESAAITQKDSSETYAQGIVKGKKNTWWLAAKNKSGDWIIVADGSSYVNCEEIASYQFPPSIVPVCWSSKKNTLINR